MRSLQIPAPIGNSSANTDSVEPTDGAPNWLRDGSGGRNRRALLTRSEFIRSQTGERWSVDRVVDSSVPGGQVVVIRR